MKLTTRFRKFYRDSFKKVQNIDRIKQKYRKFPLGTPGSKIESYIV